MSYHVARLASLFKNAKTVSTEKTRKGLQPGTEVEAFSAFDTDSNTLRIMAYNFKNSIDYGKTADLELAVNAPQFDGKEIKVTAYIIDDSCNFFDEWVEDRKELGIDSS